LRHGFGYTRESNKKSQPGNKIFLIDKYEISKSGKTHVSERHVDPALVTQGN